jgi:hypothetical protein
MSRCLLRWSLAASCLAFALCTLAWAQQPKTQRFTLTLSTRTQALPFKMPNIPNMPNIPGMADFGKPQRTIEGQAVYGEQAVEPIFVTVPGDLKLKQNRLVLTVPKPAGPTVVGPAEPGAQPQGGKFKVTSKLYWHPDTAEGPIAQSAEIDLSQAGPGPGRPGMAMPQFDLGALMEGMEKTATGQESKLPENVVGQGNYVLNTGGTAVLDGFLPAIKVAQPEDLNETDLTQGIDVQWEAVEGARGYILHAMGMVGAMGQAQEMTTIQWVSTLKEPPDRVRSDYTVATTIQDDLDSGILLPGDATSCKVPPDIFPEDVTMFTLTVTAVGNDFYSNTDDIVVYGRIRSEWTGMRMAGMMGMMGMPGMPAGENE